MKKKNIEFIKEFVSYFIVTFVLLCIAKKFGKIENSIFESSLGLTIGWLIWKTIIIFLTKKNKKQGE